MVQRRVVRTRVPIREGLFVFGSGYLVATGRVLTARHVLTPENTEPSVGQACDVLLWPWDPAQGWLPGRVAWLHPQEDAAILSVDGAGDDLPPVRWGRIDEESDLLEWRATGFPVVGLDPNGRRVEETAYGRLAPDSAESIGGLALNVESRKAKQDREGGSGWAGLSGAAVLSGGLLIGIVLSDPVRWGDSLDGVRSVRLLEDPDLAAASGTSAETVQVTAASSQGQAAESPPVRFVGEHVSSTVVHWQDRDQIREDLKAALLTPVPIPRILSVTGRRGIGKSATVDNVVAEFERADPSRHPREDLDGIVSLSTRTGPGSLSLARVFEEVTRLVPEPLATGLRRDWDQHGRLALPSLWQALANRRYVLVLDNLDDPPDGAPVPLRDPEFAALLDSVCHAPAPPRVVTTSGPSLPVPVELDDFVQEFPMDTGLDSTHAVRLLRSIVRGKALDTYDDEELARATRRLSGIPRGIELLADLLKQNPLAVRTVLDSDATADQLVAKLVSTAFTGLDPVARHVVELLALAEVRLPEGEVAEILAGLVDPDEVLAVLQPLVLSREVGFDEDSETLQLHALDADYVHNHLLETEPGMQVDLDRRLARWYSGQRTAPDTWRTLADVVPDQRAFRHLWRAGDHVEAMAVLTGAADFLARKGESPALRSAIAAAEDVVPDGVGRMYLERCRYAVEFFSGPLSDAEDALRATRAAAVSAGLPAVVDDLDVNLGIVQRHRGNCTGAVQTLQALLARDPAGLAHHLRLQALLELGLTFCYLRDWASAEAAATELEEQLRPDDLSQLLAAPSDIRALARLGAGDYDGAIAAADLAIDRYQDSPNADNAGYLYNVRGLVWLERGTLDRAQDEFRRALDLAAEFHIDRLEGICATNLAWALLRASHWDDALAAARLGAERLASIGSESADTPAILADLIAGLAPRDVPAELRRAVDRSFSNSDFYAPSDEVLGAIAGSLRNRSAAPSGRA